MTTLPQNSTDLTPDKPSISVKMIIKRRDNIVKGLTQYLGHKLIAEKFQSFVDSLHQQLPDGILRNTVLESVRDLLKKELRPEDLITVCWRLAANIDLLQHQVTVGPWRMQTSQEWVAAEIIDTRVIKKLGKFHHEVSFKILSGTPTSEIIMQTWSSKKTHYLAKYRDEKENGFGFGKRRINKRGEEKGRLLFMDIKQFFGLRCLLLIDPKESKDTPIALEVGHSSATTAYNKGLLKQRDRLQTPCVKGLRGDPECFNCPYGKDKCGYATHKTSYQIQLCGRCTKRGFVDNSDLEYPDICITCANAERFK